VAAFVLYREVGEVSILEEYGSWAEDGLSACGGEGGAIRKVDYIPSEKPCSPTQKYTKDSQDGILDVFGHVNFVSYDQGR